MQDGVCFRRPTPTVTENLNNENIFAHRKLNNRFAMNDVFKFRKRYATQLNTED